MRVFQTTRRRLASALAAVSLLVGLVVVQPTAGFAAQSAAMSGADSAACLVDAPSGVMPEPFMKLPFRAADAAGSLYDTQGWITSPDELSIDGEVNGDLHGANDLEFVRTPDYGYGKPVLAAFSGHAYFSYQYISGSWTDPATGITHQVGMGAGLVVEVRQQDQPGSVGWVTQYIHLSGVAKKIPYLAATPVPGTEDADGRPDWRPTGILTDDNTLWNEGVAVEQGDVIGYQGDTGIGLDWKDDFNGITGKVTPRNRVVLRPWDPPQLHFQLYQGRVFNGASWAKQNIVDPFGWYAQVCPGEFVPGQTRVNPYGVFPGFMKVQLGNTAFLTDRFGRPVYAG